MVDKLLLVDDDQSFLSGLTMALEKMMAKFSMITAENGLQAIEALQQHAIRLVVTDLLMPQMDGFELLAYMRGQYPDIPVVVTTGHAIADTQRDAIERSVFAIMRKPFKFNQLHSIIHRLLKQQADGGTLHNIPPAMVLQLINMEGKTCTLRITEVRTGRFGVCFFNEGQLLDARVGDMQGEQAAKEIFSWDQISLVIQNNCLVSQSNIHQTLNALILEAARHKDEKKEMIATAQDQEKIILAKVKQHLHQHPDVESNVSQVAMDSKWRDLMVKLSEIGIFFECGCIKVVGVNNGHDQDVVLVPAHTPICMQVDAKLSKEPIYQALMSLE
jgi:CheY-like chemotaxis protein